MKAGLTKDRSIWQFLADLSAKIESSRYQVVDHWDADLFAIGLASLADAHRLVYVSTHERRTGQFFAECEQAGVGSVDGAASAYESVSVFESISLEDLIATIERHLLLGDLNGRG